MTVLRNNFSTGPDGTDITAANSGTGEDDPFDTYNNVGTSGRVLKYKTADGLLRPTAEFVMRAETGATAGAENVVWYTTMGTQSQFWMRAYVYFSVLPNNAISPLFFQAIDLGSGTTRADLGVFSQDGTGRLFSEYLGGGVVYTTSAVAAGAWWRVEARFQTSSTVGNAEIRYFEDADSDEPTETLSFSNANMGGPTASYWGFGYTVSDANLETLYMSGIALSSEGWIGPAPFRPGKGVPGVLSTPIAVTDDSR